METVARRFFFSGRVQGVGFRHTTASLANEYPVSGYVRNLTDGRVELYLEAKLAPIDDLLKRIQEHFSSHIQNVEVQEASPEGYRSFAIRRD